MAANVNHFAMPRFQLLQAACTERKVVGQINQFFFSWRTTFYVYYIVLIVLFL